MRTSTWDRERFGQILEEIRKGAALEGTELAALAGLSRSQYNRWARAENRPGHDALQRLATAIKGRFPDLASLADELIVVAGYGPADADLTRRAVEHLKAQAAASGRTLGEILLERGLATPEELTVSDEKRGDPIVREIEESDLSDETKDLLITAYARERRQYFREQGLS